MPASPVSFEVSRGSGILAGLEDIDVSNSAGAENGLSVVEGMIRRRHRLGRPRSVRPKAASRSRTTLSAS